MIELFGKLHCENKGIEAGNVGFEVVEYSVVNGFAEIIYLRISKRFLWKETVCSGDLIGSGIGINSFGVVTYDPGLSVLGRFAFL